MVINVCVQEDGQTCLHLACSKGDENIIRTLYLARASPAVMDKEDRTAMHLAAERGHTATVEFLADKFRASVFDRTKDGSTLMHIAALNGHPETAMVSSLASYSTYRLPSSRRSCSRRACRC